MRGCQQHDVALTIRSKRKSIFKVYIGDGDQVWNFVKDFAEEFQRASKIWDGGTKTNYIRKIVSIHAGFEGWEIVVAVPRQTKRLYKFMRDFSKKRGLSLLDHVNDFSSFDRR